MYGLSIQLGWVRRVKMTSIKVMTCQTQLIWDVKLAGERVSPPVYGSVHVTRVKIVSLVLWGGRGRAEYVCLTWHHTKQDLKHSAVCSLYLVFVTHVCIISIKISYPWPPLGGQWMRYDKMYIRSSMRNAESAANSSFPFAIHCSTHRHQRHVWHASHALNGKNRARFVWWILPNQRKF